MNVFIKIVLASYQLHVSLSSTSRAFFPAIV